MRREPSKPLKPDTHLAHIERHALGRPHNRPSGDGRAGYWTTLDQDFHWHIAILPRPTQVTGLEVGTGLYANNVTPEVAAATLRGRPCTTSNHPGLEESREREAV